MTGYVKALVLGVFGFGEGRTRLGLPVSSVQDGEAAPGLARVATHVYSRRRAVPQNTAGIHFQAGMTTAAAAEQAVLSPTNTTLTLSSLAFWTLPLEVVGAREANNTRRGGDSQVQHGTSLTLCSLATTLMTHKSIGHTGIPTYFTACQHDAARNGKMQTTQSKQHKQRSTHPAR